MYEAKGKKKMQKGNSGDSLYCCSWTLKVPRQSAFSLSFWAFLYLFMLCLVIVVVVSVQSYVTVCNPMDCCPLDSCVHGILQARILEWVAIPFSRGSSQPRDRTQVSCIAGWDERGMPCFEEPIAWWWSETLIPEYFFAVMFYSIRNVFFGRSNVYSKSKIRSWTAVSF